MGLRFGIQVLYSDEGFRVKIQVRDKVWDSFLRFRFGICFWCSCLGFGYAVLVCDSGFGYRFGIEVSDSGFIFRWGFQG